MAHASITKLAKERTSPFFAAAASRVPVHTGSIRWAATHAPGSCYKIETNVADAANVDGATTEVQVEVSGPALLGASWLRVNLAEPNAGDAAAGYVAFPGLHLIKQLEVIVDGERVGPVMRDYPSSLKVWLKYQDPSYVEAFLQAMGGSGNSLVPTTVMVPLITPWGATTGYHAGEQQWLPLHKIKGRREVVFRIVFASTDDLDFGGGAGLDAGNKISSCSVVSMAAYVDEAAIAEDRSSIAILSRGFASLPLFDTSASVIGDAGADTLTLDIRQMQGAIESVHVLSRAGASLVGSAVYSDTDLTVTEMELNGETWWRTTRGVEPGADAREHQYEQAVLGFGTSDLTAAGLGSESYPIIPMCIYPRSDAFSGALPMGSSVSTLNITVGTTAGDVDSVAVVGVEVGCLTLDANGRMKWRKAL